MDIFKAYWPREFARSLKEMKMAEEDLVQMSNQEAYNGRKFSNKTCEIRKYF